MARRLPGVARDAGGGGAHVIETRATDSPYWLDDTIDLEPLLANRRWVAGSEPFRHIRVRNVFKPHAYRAIDRAFRKLLAEGFGEKRGPRFSRAMPGYDAFGVNFGPDLTGPFRVFTSRAWHDTFAQLFDVQPTGHVMCGLHHHAVGGESGHVHNDLNPGWFAGDVAPGEIGLAQHDLISYST